MNNKLIAIVMTLVVGIILAGSVLMPVVNDARTTTSTEVNYTNEETTFRMAGASDVVTLTLSSGTVTLNDVAIEKISNSNILLSDAVSLDQFQYQGNWLNRMWFKDSTALQYPSAFELTFENGNVTGTVTISDATTSIDTTYSYLFYADSEGDYIQMTNNDWANGVYLNNANQLILSGLYTTGENDTTYSYVDGVFTTGGDYTGSVELTTEKVGMDVIKATALTVTIGEETFTPFRALVPMTVVGHTETPASNLIGVIPVLVIVSLVVAAIGMVVVKRD